MNKFLFGTILVIALVVAVAITMRSLNIYYRCRNSRSKWHAFGPDGYLYAASVIGSDITVIDTENKNIIKRYGLSEGVIGPDDVAFNSKGEFLDINTYWEVAGFNTKGEKVVAGNPGPGVNQLPFLMTTDCS